MTNMAIHKHSYPIQPPAGTFVRPGNCECGHTWDEEEAAQAAEVAAIEWSVYIVGANTLLVAQGQEFEDIEPVGPPFTEETATAHAAELNALFARLRAEDPSPLEPALFAVVLHCGVPVETEAGA